ncbi:AEX-3 domain-containing protein [Dissophora ornata]|nr:AEX-3 domain-containing protein [Dissophora ornata]
MSSPMNSPKRIANYFFIVGLRDDTSLYPLNTDDHQHTHAVDQEQDGPGTVDVARTVAITENTAQLQARAPHHVLLPPQLPAQLPGQRPGQTLGTGTGSTPTPTPAPPPPPTTTTTTTTGAGHPQGPLSPRHNGTSPNNPRRLSYAAIAAANISNPRAPLAPSPLAHTSAAAAILPNRARSKSMAHFHPPVVPTLEKQDPDSMAQRGPQTVYPVRPSRRLSTASMVGPPRRSITTNNVSNPGNTVLQHKPNYRYVSAGALYKSMQEGLEFDKNIDDAHDEGAPYSLTQQLQNAQTGPTAGVNHSDKQASLGQDIRSVALGRTRSIMRSRAKVPPVEKSSRLSEAPEIKSEPRDVHPAEKVYTPVVTCRYPETDWKDAEPFPKFLSMFCFPADLSFKFADEQPPTVYHSFVLTQETGVRSYAMCVTIFERPPQNMHQQLDAICQRWTRAHMSESEIEYAKAIKIKISREQQTLQRLQMQLREEKTMGRKARQAQHKREISDSEEKLSLLHDQMKPWRGLFVDIDSAWIPRCIGLVSAVPFHNLLRDWLLAVVVACSGGVEHPGMSSSSLPLESYVKNLIHEVNLPPFGKLEVGITINDRVIYASRPAVNRVPIVKNFSLFPLFKCLSAEDIVTIIEVILSEGRVIFVSSYLGMLTLACESFLYLLFPLYWQGVYVPILPSALMTYLQAPVPYIIGVERRSRDSDFPPEDACVVDLDNGSVEVQLAPIQLPPRQRRKLIQSLELYAPTSAMRRSPGVVNPTLGPPVYVKEAFPHSRLTLLCDVSFAPRPSRREKARSHHAASSSSSSTNGSVTYSGNGSLRDLNNVLGMPTGQSGKRSSADTISLGAGNQSSQPQLYSKVVGGMARSASEGILDRNPDLDVKDATQSKDTLGRSDSMKYQSPYLNHGSTESFKTVSRKVLSPSRTRSNMFEGSKKHDGSSITTGMLTAHPSINRHNSNQSTYVASIASGYDGPGLRHRASFTSIDSSTSSILSKSPVSTMTSNTMASINGSVSSATVSMASPEEDGTFTASGESGRTAPMAIEGHILSSIPTPVPISITSCRCVICSQVFATQNMVYRCEGCSLYIHAGCLDELLYPCEPRGFDEPRVCWSVLQMWAGLMKGYRSGIIAGAAHSQSQQYSSLQHRNQLQQQQQHQQQHAPSQPPSRRRNSHAKQLSNSESEGERDGGRDRLSWASFQRWTGRNAQNGSSHSLNSKLSGSFSQPNWTSTSLEQTHQQQVHSPAPRLRNSTDSSCHSDTVTFHRDIFMKSVDKDSKVRFFGDLSDGGLQYLDLYHFICC